MKHILWSVGYNLDIEDIVRAENCDLYDSEGKKYLDLESGVWCTSVGHCNPRVNNAIKSQLDNISHTGFCYGNSLIDTAALNILEITNLVEGKCEFICSGSEAVEYGMRVAKTITNKPLSLTFSDSYFGAYGEASKRDNENWYIYNWLNCSCKSTEYGCTGDCSEFDNISFEQIGIFLFEPGSSSGLVRFPSQKLITKIVERIRKGEGIVLINEVTTGVGRTGKWFGYQHYNSQPDIVAIGKGIGNGYPVSITAISNKVTKLLEGKQYLYSQSHQNDPLGAIVANEVINIIKEENLLERSERLGKEIVHRLNLMKNKLPILKTIRGRGLMIAIEFFKHAEIIRKELLKNGFIVGKRKGAEVLRMDPALTVDEKDIKSFLDTFERITEDVSDM